MSAPTFEHRHYKAIAAIIASIGDEDDRAEQAHFFAAELRGRAARHQPEIQLPALPQRGHGRAVEQP